MGAKEGSRGLSRNITALRVYVLTARTDKHLFDRDQTRLESGQGHFVARSFLNTSRSFQYEDDLSDEAILYNR